MLFEGMIVDFPDGFELHSDPLNLRALAFYRQAKVAEQYSLAYACLSYYKILEIEKKGKGVSSLNDWIGKKIDKLHKLNRQSLPQLEVFAEKNKNSLVEFLFKGVRNEAAHYMTDSEINLDDNSAKMLFGHAAKPLEDLATFYIEEALEISDNLFSVSYHKNSQYAYEKSNKKNGI